MPFDPQDFLTLAQTTVGSATANEAELRTAISRAYYAVHLHARETLSAASHMQSTKSGADHGIVISKLRSRGGSLGDQVDWLRVRRHRADYRLGSPVASQAQQIVTVAQNVWGRI